MLRILRLLAGLLLVLFGGLGILLAVGWDRARRRDPLQGAGRCAQAAWCRAFCCLFGVAVQRCGEPTCEPPTLLVANHVSWLDIVCLAAAMPVVFLSKAEVRAWPLVGRVATALGTCYIERGSRQGARHAVTRLTEALAAGRRVVLFPEGTTSSGNRVRAFRARLYQAAVDSGAPVQPLTLCYRTPDGAHCPDAAFVDDQPLPASVWRLAGVRRVEATLLAHPPIPAGVGRSELARASRASVASGLSELLGRPGGNWTCEADRRQAAASKPE